MNRAVNIFSSLFATVYVALAVAIVYDLSFSSMWTLKGMPFKAEILATIALLVLLLGLIRVKRRWQGIRDMKDFSKFSFDWQLSKETMSYSVIFTFIEIAFMIALIIACGSMYKLHPEYTIPMIIAASILLVEALIFAMRLIKGGKSFRLGINKEVVAYFNREMHLYYYTGLTRIELAQDDLINFQYREELNLFLPTSIIKKEDRKEFREALIQTLADKNVYIDDAFREWE